MKERARLPLPHFPLAQLVRCSDNGLFLQAPIHLRASHLFRLTDKRSIPFEQESRTPGRASASVPATCRCALLLPLLHFFFTFLQILSKLSNISTKSTSYKSTQAEPMIEKRSTVIITSTTNTTTFI